MAAQAFELRKIAKEALGDAPKYNDGLLRVSFTIAAINSISFGSIKIDCIISLKCFISFGLITFSTVCSKLFAVCDCCAVSILISSCSVGYFTSILNKKRSFY